MIFVVVLALSALGLVTATAAVLLRPGDDRAPTEPASEVVAQPTPTPSASADSTPAPSPTRSGRPPETLGRPVDLGDIAQQVEEIRQLSLSTRLNSRLVEEAGLADKVSDLAFEEQDPREIRDTEQLLIALRLADPEVDLAAIVEDVYREQILGLYVPEEATLYVRRRGEDSPAQQMTTAHEITHALQDQAFGLVELQEAAEDDDDAALAMLSLVEGDAVLTQQLWAQQHLTADELAEAAGETAGGDALGQAPDYVRASLFFPYSQGELFVAELYRTGGYDAVNAAFESPPTSTEQILHPDRYRDGDAPVSVPLRARPGRSWRPASRYEFGEFDLDQLLQPLGEETAETAAEGWDGGAVRSWSSPQGTAVAARLVFDDTGEAAQACEALPQWYEAVADGESIGDGSYEGDRDHLAVVCEGMVVSFGLAPSPQTARKLAAAP